jgi:hypothetical protein
MAMKNIPWIVALLFVFLGGIGFGASAMSRTETVTSYLTRTETRVEILTHTQQIVVTISEMRTLTIPITTTIYASETAGGIIMSDSGTGDKDTRPFTLSEETDIKVVFTLRPRTEDLGVVFLGWLLYDAETMEWIRKGEINEAGGMHEFYLTSVPPGKYFIRVLAANTDWKVSVYLVGAETATTTTTTEKPPTTATTTTTPTTQACDPSYPDVCIPPPPPDLDCNDIPYRNFRVLPPDPHHFDTDGDGIGCET